MQAARFLSSCAGIPSSGWQCSGSLHGVLFSDVRMDTEQKRKFKGMYILGGLKWVVL